MKNLLFFLWMLLYPLLDDVSDYIKFKATGQPKKNDNLEDESNSDGYWMVFAFYLIVAYLLYEGH